MTFVLGLGGTTRDGSTSERALRAALAACGGETQLIGAAELELPMYEPGRSAPFLDAVRRADGVIIASPGYHGGISGLLKNALDYIEELRSDERPYLDGRAVGCIVCGSGWQAPAAGLASLRAVVHALRGWPTPLGVAINSALPLDDRVTAQLQLVARQVVDFAEGRASRLAAP